MKKLSESGSRSISVEGGVLEGGKEKREDKRRKHSKRSGVENWSCEVKREGEKY